MFILIAFTIIHLCCPLFQTVIKRTERKKTHALRYIPLVKMLLILFGISSVESTTPCNSFPKIIGGSLNHTLGAQIDIYNDYLVLAGGTGIQQFIPFIALTSISTGGKYYWAKVLSLKQNDLFVGVQFSTDGALIIGQIQQYVSLSSNCIVVFYVSSGKIASARVYSSGGYSNYNQLRRSMVISSGPSPMAYVLSNFKTTFNHASCTGQHLFKFDPLSFTNQTPQVWIKKTIQSTTKDDCGNFGLVFGRNQSFFYAFSWYNGSSTVSLLDTAGNSQWQYSTLYGGVYSNTIQYKAIDSSKDMIIASSGFNNIYFNRIISSTSSPYPVLDSQQFVDRYTYRSLDALYIIDQDKAVSLQKNSKITFLAQINFKTSKISYQRAFPQFRSDIKSAVFTSPNIYYVMANSKEIFTAQSPFYQLVSNCCEQSTVYSSDMTSTSCYSMEPIITPTPQTMASSTTNIIQIPSSIYELSPITLNNETQAYTTLNIIQSQLTDSSQWCPYNTLGPFTVTQQFSSYTVAIRDSDQYFIAPFSATLNCGSYPNSWSYIGYNNLNGNNLDNLTDLIGVDSLTGQIFVSKYKPPGTYKILIIGTLSDYSTYSSIFTIIVSNTAPVFQTSLLNLTIPLMSSLNYSLPSIYDPDLVDNYTLYIKNSTGQIPSFINQTGSNLTISPKLITDAKLHQIFVVLNDTYNITQYQFQINVTNQPPKVNSTIQTWVNMTFGQSMIYDLPYSIDPEGLPFKTTLKSGQSFAQLISSSQVKLFPVNCATDLGNQTVQIQIEDEQPASSVYSFNITVTHLPPIFQTIDAIENQFVQYNTIKYQTLPEFSDPEGCPVTPSFKPEILSQFISIKGNQIVYSPNQMYQVGKHELTLIITDNQGLYDNKTFYVVVFLPPKFVGNLPKIINLKASIQDSYNLPLQGNSDEYITHLGLPSYVSFESSTYYFFPNKVNDLGMSIILGQLFNAYTSIIFQLNVNVINEAPQFTAKLQNQVVVLNSKLSYFTPEVYDREGQTIRFTTHEVGQPILPFFAKFLPLTKEFQFSPTWIDQQKDYKIQLNIIDSFGATSSAIFTVTIKNAVAESKTATQEQNSNTLLKTQNITSSGAAFSISTMNKKQQSEAETQILGIELLKVTRDHKATLKIYNPTAAVGQKTKVISEIMLQISNQTFSAYIYVLQSNMTYKITFQVIEKDLTNCLIQANLKFPNPSNVSTSQTPDKLKLQTLNRIQIMKNQILTILPERSTSETNIPTQITQSYEQALVAISQGGRIAFTQDTTSNMIIGFAIQIIWIQFEDISFLVINSLLQISIPGLPSTIQGFLMKYIFFDILYTELWISKFMSGIGIDYDNVKNDTAINVQFSNNGFDSKQFLKNSGSSFFFLLFYIFSWLILLLLFILSKRSIKINSLKDKLQKQLIWKQSLNFLINQLPILFQCSLLNFYDMRLQDEQVVAKLSSIISILVFIGQLTAIIIIVWKVYRLTKNLNNIQVTDFNQNYSILTESLKETKVKKIIFFWKPLYLIRWTLTIMVLTMIQDYPSFQILCLLGFSAVQQYLILTTKPYQSRAVNIITFVNEVAVSIYLYLSFMVSDYLDTQIIDNQPLLYHLKLQIAWVLTCVLVAAILINFIFAIVNIVAGTIRFIKSKIKCQRKKESKQEKQIKLQEFLNERKDPQIKDQIPQTKYQESPQVDITVNQDFTKLGYESYEYYPGSYAFPKIIKNVKNDQPFEKENQVFNFYDHI